MSKQDSLQINVHPLVLMNIADHYTRSIAQFRVQRAIGVLMGTQTGRDVQIYDSFEVGFEEEKDRIVIKESAVEDDIKLYTTVYKQREFLGWYTTGTKLLPGDHELHQVFTRFNERPFVLLFDTASKPDQRELPVAFFEEEVRVEKEKTSREFVRVQYNVQSDEAERIAAVHCAKVVVGQEGGAAITPHLASLHKAVKMLNVRVKLLRAFLRDVEDGKVKATAKQLRDIKSVCNRLPTVDSQTFREDFLAEYNDGLMVTLLASLTKGTQLASDVVDKFEVAQSGSSARPGRGMRGMDVRMFEFGGV